MDEFDVFDEPEAEANTSSYDYDISKQQKTASFDHENKYNDETPYPNLNRTNSIQSNNLIDNLEI